MTDREIAVSLPEELIAEWKFLVELRQKVEGNELDPIAVLRQAIATETYLWRQKGSALSTARQHPGRIAGRL